MLCDSIVSCCKTLMFVFHCRMERTVYTLLRTRDSLMRNCKEFQIPVEWMLDNGIIGKVYHNGIDECVKEAIFIIMLLHYYDSRNRCVDTCLSNCFFIQ